MGLLLAHVNQTPRNPGDVCPGLPPALVALVSDLLAKDPAAWLADAREVIRRLRLLDVATYELWDRHIASIWWQKHVPLATGGASASGSAAQALRLGARQGDFCR